jgi:hypothetical protein
MKTRLGFVSNSSSSSFIIPKKYLSEKDLAIYHEYSDNGHGICCDDDLNETEKYIYGRVSMHNMGLNNLFKKFKNLDGVEYYD